MSLIKHQLILGESVMLRRIMLTATSIALGLISINALAGHATLEDCIKIVNGVKKGSIARVEYHNFSNEGKPAYELEIVDSEGISWEFECDKHVLYSRPEQKSRKQTPWLRRLRYIQARMKKLNMKLNSMVHLPTNLISRARMARNSMSK